MHRGSAGGGMFIGRFIASLLVGLSAAASDAAAGEFVAIETGASAESDRLIGYLARPPGAGERGRH